MPSEIDSNQPSSQPLMRFDPPIGSKNTGLVPLKDEAQKTQATMEEFRGLKSEKKTTAHIVARAALGAYTQSIHRQASPNFFLELINSVVDYIKEKFSSPQETASLAIEISSPFNVKQSSLENDLRTQLENVDHNLSNPDDLIPLDPNLPKTRTELKEALSEFVSRPFDVKINMSNHLKLAKEQLQSLKQQLIDHPGEEPKGLNPSYPQELIPLENFITDLEKNLKELKENKIQALSDLGEDEAYLYDEVNRRGDKSYGELQREFDAEPIPHRGIEPLNETIRLLEMELESLRIQHERRVNTLKQQPAFNLERNQQHLMARYEKDASALINKIESKNAELAELEASRTPLTRGDLRKAEGKLKFSEGLEKIIAGRKKMALEAFEAEVKRLQSAIKSDSYSMRSEKAVKDLTKQIDSLEAKLDQLYFSEDSELESILELENEINKLKDRRINLENSQIFKRMALLELAVLKNVREGEVESFNDIIRIQNDTLERIDQDLEDLEILDQREALLAEKETLETQLAMNYATLNEIMEELEILNASETTKIQTPTTGALQDLEGGT